jgi:amino acid adenylation domain-containing protein
MSDLAARITALSPERQALLRQYLEARARPREAPLSPGQERLWFLERLAPGTAAYHVPAALRLRGELDAAALDRALAEVVARHEILRTRFVERDGAPVQVVDAAPAAPLITVDDLRSLAPDEREAALEERLAAEALRTFDLAAEHPLRARLWRLGEAEHALHMVTHHIATDGWSLGIMQRELWTAYHAISRGERPAWAPLPMQYADHASAQRELLSGERLEREMAFWRAHLDGAPPTLELPIDRPRPAALTFRGSSVERDVGAATLDALRALGREERSTLYITLLAVWHLLLARLAGVDDVVVGSPVAGRTSTQVEPLIGFFVNTIAVRADLTGDPSFRGLLRRVREAAVGALRHQDFPFDRVVEMLAPGRSSGVNPVFQTIFALEPASGAAARLPGLAMEPLRPNVEAPARFDLSLFAFELADRLSLGLSYSTDLFDAATAERMVAQYARLLEQIVARPDLRISELELLSAEEHALVVADWNRTTTAYPRERCVHELFSEQAALTPGARALDGETGALSYAELDARSNRLAHLLRARGVGADTRVGVLLERGPELVVALLAILKAGGAYVPLDPEYPPERLAFMLRDSGAALVMSASALPKLLEDSPCPVLRLDAEALDGQPDTPPESNAGPESLAYIVYTSGSTGTPKGVMVPHRAIVRLVRGATYARFGPAETHLLLAPVTFDAATFEIWGALLNGARLAIAPPGPLSPAELGTLLERFEVRTLWLTAGLFHQVVDAAPEALRPLRQLLAGGEALSPAHCRRVLEAHPDLRLINGYGPTENTTFSCCHTIDAGVGESVPIGRPIQNSRAYVLDVALRPVPIGVWGELYVGGDGVARGYLGRAALTAERFIPDAFSQQPSARLYRTGDRVRWSVDGVLEFGGRFDQQLKVRGHRIEPGEIEAALLAHPDVAEAAVVALGEADDKRLVAYVVARAAGLDVDALREHVGERLPAYMVPAAFVVLDQLPLTRNGKLDRRALPAPEFHAANAYTAPRTPVEETLAAIWAEVLGVERVGVEDDFFQLGGHSLLATRVVSRAQAALGVELPLRLLFEHPTVAALSAQLDALRREGQQLRLHPIVPASREGALPLSFGQERLWFLERLAPGSAAYHVPIALRLGGALDAEALESAWSEVVRRHEVLRTRYPEHEGIPAQAIDPAARVAIPVEDVASLEELREHLSAEMVRTFDLAEAPPVRVRLWRLAPEDHVLLICIHHIATDGWSTGLMMGELSALYAGFRDGAAPRLPELPVQYADYAAWQREHLSGERLEAQLAYWRTRLAGAAPLELPTDRARPAVQSFRGGGVEQELGGPAVRALRALAAKTGSTPFMVLLAGWQALLGRMSGQDDVTVGTPIAGRTRRELEGLVGFFVNTLALRTDLSGDPTFGELVARVRETTLGAYQHQELPFEHLVDAIAPERSLSRNPLFQVSFALQQGTGGDGGLGGLSIAATPIRSQTAQFDLALTVVDSEERLRCALQFSTDLYDEATARGLLERYARLLEQAASAPDVRLSRLELLSPDERERVLADWNRTDTAFPAPRPLHELISEQAARTPAATAVEGESGTLSYAELEERANRLAHLLREHGVGPETRVGILLERTPELFVALLGVLKAGGAYVPLDPEYPAERLAFILQDSGAALLLTHSGLAERIAGGLRLHLDRLGDDLARRPATPPPALSGADGLVYVLYTSGSTGRPKGALLTHDALVNRLLWMQQALPLAPGDGVLHKTAFGFDVAGWELFWPLLVGARVVLARPGGQRDPAYLARRVAETGISTLHFVPSMLPAFLDAVDAQPGAGASLRHVVCSGEALGTALAERTLRTLPGAVLWNLYGPTEAAIDVTARRVASAADAQGAGGGVPLGQPIANTQTYVLDAALRPAPLGAWGELYLGGVQLARGYLARPGLTAERFVPDPYGGRSGARLYRTGDRARWRADGVLEYGGRLDEQVKVRGQRIEPGEVEAVLLSHSNVTEAAVVALGEAEDKRLVAYVVARDELDTAALRTHAEARLPAYMVPSAFVVLEQLPLTPNGKLDRRALPAPEFRAAAAYTAPRTPTEETLAAIWAEVLGIERVGVEDGFFELGGHSLLATRVVARAQAAFGVELPLRLVFEHPTVATLAAHLETLRREGQQLRLDPIVPASREGALPLSFGQERLWFLEHLTPGSATYHVPLALRLGGALDTRALESAWGEVVRRHEVLRTRYVEHEGTPTQVIEPAQPPAIPAEDLSRLPSAESELRERLRAEAMRPFDLAAAPPVRVRLWRVAKDDHVLLICIHHIATDGWSTELLVRGAVRACTAPLAAGRIRRSRRCRCSTRTTRCGSASTFRANGWRGSSPTGAAASPARRRWSFPRTGRGPASPPIPAPPSSCASRAARRRGCARWRGRRGARRSWCCSRGGRRCWGG